jgi:hypothetical protein
MLNAGLARQRERFADLDFHPFPGRERDALESLAMEWLFFTMPSCL